MNGLAPESEKPVPVKLQQERLIVDVQSSKRSTLWAFDSVNEWNAEKEKADFTAKCMIDGADGKYYRLNCSMTVVFNERYHSAEHGARVGNVNGKRFIKRVVK